MMNPIRYAAACRSAAVWAKTACVAVFAALLAVGFPSTSEGATLEEVIASLEAAQGNIFDATQKYREGQPGAARVFLEAALGNLANIQLALQDAELAAQLDKNLNALVKKLAQSGKSVSAVMEWVDPDPDARARTVTAVLAMLLTTAKSIQLAEAQVVKPLLDGKGGEVGGGVMIWALDDPFNYKANQEVSFRLYPPGYPTNRTWSEDPVVTFYNGGITTAIDSSGYTIVNDDKKPGCKILKFRMGPGEGVAHFDVAYGGRITHKLVYNRGGKGAASLPYAMPQLQRGNYQVSFSVSASAWVMTPQGLVSASYSLPAGSFPTKIIGMKNPLTFYKDIMKVFNTSAAAAFQAAGFSGGAASVTSVSENGFAMTFSGKYGDRSQGGTFIVVITITLI